MREEDLYTEYSFRSPFEIFMRDILNILDKLEFKLINEGREDKKNKPDFEFRHKNRIKFIIETKKPSTKGRKIFYSDKKQFKRYIKKYDYSIFSYFIEFYLFEKKNIEPIKEMMRLILNHLKV